MISRKNPDVGYIEDSLFQAFSFAQTVRAGDTAYFSGIAPLRGGTQNLELVGAGDLRAQVEFCYEILGHCLADEGLGFEHVVSTTLYTTDMDTLTQCGDILGKVLADHPPTAAAVQVQRLFHPLQMFELQAIACVS